MAFLENLSSNKVINAPLRGWDFRGEAAPAHYGKRYADQPALEIAPDSETR